MDTNGKLRVRVTTYHGIPREVDGIPTRDRVVHDEAAEAADVINDPYASVAIDLALGGPAAYSLDDLIEDFQDEHGCRISYLEGDGTSGLREFDVFEPSWPSPDEASDVAGDLSTRLLDFVHGNPSGR